MRNGSSPSLDLAKRGQRAPGFFLRCCDGCAMFAVRCDAWVVSATRIVARIVQTSEDSRFQIPN